MGWAAVAAAAAQEETRHLQQRRRLGHTRQGNVSAHGPCALPACLPAPPTAPAAVCMHDPVERTTLACRFCARWKVSHRCATWVPPRVVPPVRMVTNHGT